MNFKAYAETIEGQLPPLLVGGDILRSVTAVEKYTYTFEGNEIPAMRVLADGKVFRTSSKVLIEQLEKYFAKNTEPLTDVKIVAPRGKKYLTLGEA